MVRKAYDQRIALTLFSSKISDCERSESSSFAQGEVNHFIYCRGT